MRQLIKRALRRAMPERLFVVDGPRKGAVYLTFDDGPHPEHTPVLLDALAAAGARATFFVIGERAAAHPELVRRALAEGHAVGSHSWTHSPAEETSAEKLARETVRADGFLQSLGARPFLTRPPYGAVGVAKLGALWAARQQVVLWNRDPRDYAMKSAAELTAWFEREPLAGGQVVLLHDVFPHAAAALPAAIAAARARGLGFAAF